MITSPAILTAALRVSLAACADLDTDPIVATYEPGDAVLAFGEGREACALVVLHRGQECSPGVYLTGAELSDAEQARVAVAMTTASA